MYIYYSHCALSISTQNHIKKSGIYVAVGIRWRDDAAFWLVGHEMQGISAAHLLGELKQLPCSPCASSDYAHAAVESWNGLKEDARDTCDTKSLDLLARRLFLLRRVLDVGFKR